MENSFKLICPRCGKRICDVARLCPVKTVIELKCPNCHNIVETACEYLPDKAIILK